NLDRDKLHRLLQGVEGLDIPATICATAVQLAEVARGDLSPADIAAELQFPKFRVVFVDGKPYACHMAIADRWDIWYLNAGMSDSAAKRLEEQTFMQTFDIGFARRHQTALTAMADRIGLDYFTIDCAENKRGELLIFEADNTAVVHNMDSPELFPYKAPQMRKVFEAFAAMLCRRAQDDREHAA